MDKYNYRVSRAINRVSMRKVRPEESNSVEKGNSWWSLQESKNCFDSLSEFRHNRARSRRYIFSDGYGQWGDLMKDPDNHGKFITEAEHISRQGRVPIQNNMIRSLSKTVLGQFRRSKTEPVCISRDRDEQKVGEMINVALEYVYQLNELWELDAHSLLEVMISGVCIDRIGFGFIPAMQKNDVHIHNVCPARMYWSRSEDVRSWDINRIGELHDYSLSDLIANFANSKLEKEDIIDLYARYAGSDIYQANGNMKTSPIDHVDFNNPYDTSMYRVIEDWALESKEMLWCHDLMKGQVYWADLSDKEYIDGLNANRTADAITMGAIPMLIEYKWKINQYWYYRFMTPLGDVLKEGESPYWHKSHPYIIRFSSLFDGKPNPFVQEIIDQNRILNRCITTWDFITNTSAKNTLAIAEGSIPEHCSPDSFASEWRKVGGVIVYKPVPSLVDGGIPREIQSNSHPVGIAEMITLMSSSLENISGVHSALQGKDAGSGVSGNRYQMEAEMASTNLIDMFQSFNAFRISRDTKIMKTIQQYWDSKRYVNIAGKNYSEEAKFYNPERAQNAEVDLSLNEGSSTPTARIAMETWLMDLLKMGYIDVEQLLSNSSMQGADSLLQQIKASKQQMDKGNSPAPMNNVSQGDQQSIQMLQQGFQQ